MQVLISDIEIGERYRKDLGDVGPLADSIAEIGLLHPIVVTPEMKLIAGHRRIAAHRLLGLTEIEATVIDLADVVKGEFAENEYRKDFTWSERVEIGRAIEPAERAVGEHNSQFAGRPKNGGNLPPISDGTKALDRVASFVGTSRHTLEKAYKICDSGYEGLIQEMDATGKVDGVYRKLQRQHREMAQPADLPPDKYGVIYADPPWCYGDKLVDGYGAAENHYPSMTIAELCALTVRELAADDAVLFLWVTSPLLEECFAVIRAWGFEYKASFVWDKMKHNYGHYNSVRHEFLLVCTRGSCLPEVARLYDSVVSVERTNRHSEKPQGFREMIEALYPSARKIELFARSENDGWHTWGNEV